MSFFRKSNLTEMQVENMKSKSNKSDTHDMPSIISGNSVISGSVNADGEVHIFGTVEGDVRSSSIVIDKGGAVHGLVLAEKVIIHGKVIGPIQGIDVKIHGNAHIEGDVIHETLSVESGAFIDGSLRHSKDPLGFVIQRELPYIYSCSASEYKLDNEKISDDDTQNLLVKAV